MRVLEKKEAAINEIERKRRLEMENKKANDDLRRQKTMAHKQRLDQIQAGRNKAEEDLQNRITSVVDIQNLKERKKQ